MLSLLYSCAIVGMASSVVAQFSVCLSEVEPCDGTVNCQNTTPSDDLCRTSPINGTYYMLFQDPVDLSIDMELFRDEWCVTPILQVVPIDTCIGYSVPEHPQIFLKVIANEEPILTNSTSVGLPPITNSTSATLPVTVSNGGSAPPAVSTSGIQATQTVSLSRVDPAATASGAVVSESTATIPGRPTGSAAASAQSNSGNQHVVQTEVMAIVAMMVAAAVQL